MILKYVLKVKCDLTTNPRIWEGGGVVELVLSNVYCFLAQS